MTHILSRLLVSLALAAACAGVTWLGIWVVAMALAGWIGS
jgi:hypothetical protein